MMNLRRGISLIDILVVLVLISISIAIAMPLMKNKESRGHRVACASNLSQIGKGMILYADSGGNGDIYPSISTTKDPMNPEADAQQALSLLYKYYINDIRVFSCPTKPLSREVLVDIPSTETPDWRTKSFKQSKPGIIGRSSSYGYSPGHKQDHNQCIVLADRQGTGPKGNSDNHGRDVGQNCLAASGNVEFRDTKKNVIIENGVTITDDDIYADQTVRPKDRFDFESFLR